MIKNYPYYNKIIDKKELKSLIGKAFREYGIASAATIVDTLKDLGFQYATKAGFSLSLEDLKVPPNKKALLNKTYSNINLAEQKYLRGEITTVERFQKVIDTWNNASETLKNEVIQYFKETDPLNPVYIMAFSGARGSIAQVRQLVGMRGLMSDPSGQIIDIPIASNFREGLNVTEYFISSYGARKGLVDTALRTADSGYLTRRLVDVAQDVIIREVDCHTKRGIPLQINNIQQLLGRVLIENIYHPETGALIATANQDINFNLAKEILNAKIPRILIRSSLTCESPNSICQLCYGWSLANDRLVDLGEAVGIIAAQSIGEPGTQLTMRTFHTGGVFTGEVAKQILSPDSGKIRFDKTPRINSIRTRHGDDAFVLLESLSLQLINHKNVVHKLSFPEGSTLFIQDQQIVQSNELLAELSIRTRLGKEKAYKQISTDIDGQVYFTDLIIEETQNKQQTKRISQAGGLIWILAGKVYNIPQNAEIIVTKEEQIQEKQTLAEIRIMNKYSGEVLIAKENHQYKTNKDIYIITNSLILKNSFISVDRIEGNKAYILSTSNENKFILKNLFGQKLFHNQVIGDLISNTYKTQTGGMIKYLDLPVEKYTLSNQEIFKIRGGGYILWVEEETHEINKDISLLLVKNGDLVETGTEIIKNVFCKNTGIVEILQKDDIVREIIIKPGKLISVDDKPFLKKKRKGFLRPGEKLSNIFEADNIVYWEYLNLEKEALILIRPVVVYSVPDSLPDVEKEFEQKAIDGLGIEVVRNICFKDGEKIKSIKGVELIKTQLVVTIPTLDPLLIPKIQIELKDSSSNYFDLKLMVIETLNIDSKIQRNSDNYITDILVKDKQKVVPNTIVAQTKIIAEEVGQISFIDYINQKVLSLTENDLFSFRVENAANHLKEFQWIKINDKISSNNISPCSGQIYKIQNDWVTVRLARPYLLSPNTILYVENKNLLKKGDVLAGLTYETFKTGDIVQGLPRIEEILEVRRKAEGYNNPHNLLESKYSKYFQGKLELKDATRLSIQEIQLFLIEAIQAVYKSQGVEIADKHIEIIVKQMSSKAKIKNGGDTGYLPGDLIEVQKIEKQNKTILSINKEPATYVPLLLGITKASLNTESFISAASFQETTKILTEAAINGKLDWLKGLKENVIIGRLIPAGTGFGNYENNVDINNEIYSNLSTSHVRELNNLKTHLDDIILDDRSLRKSPFHHSN